MSASDDDKKSSERPFTVTDRRASNTEEEEASSPPDAGLHDDVPPVDFNTFVLSLSTSALMHMGAVPDGMPAAPANIPIARQTIDLLALLEQKTAGNLTGEEERLLHEVLFDLRMRFVKLTKG